MVHAIAISDVVVPLAENASAELVVWKVPQPLRGSIHYFKYRFALIVDDICVMRFDNEAGKGDHKHVDGREVPYDFVGVAELKRDFLIEARAWLEAHGRL